MEKTMTTNNATTLMLKVYSCENSEARTLEVHDSNGKIVAVDKVENDNELYDSKLLELDLEVIEFYEDGVLTCVCEDSCEEDETDDNEDVATINASTVTTNATTAFKPLFEGDTIIVDGDFVINVSQYDGDKTLIAYIGNGGDITIPNGVNDVYAGTFEKNGNDVTSIHLPDSMNWIDEGAFCGCTNLISINIPEGVQNIGMWAFKDCKSLKSITIPNSVKTLDYAVFEGCMSLEYVKLPDGINDVPDEFFKGCSSLKCVEIPNSVKEIGIGAFSGCTSLTNVNIPDGVTTIEFGSFQGCSSLTSVTIPKSVTRIKPLAFHGCDALAEVIISNDDVIIEDVFMPFIIEE